MVRVMPGATAALLLAALVAGCAGGGPADALQDDGSVTTTVVGDDGSRNATLGTVHGVILHPTGFPIPGARITILSVDSSQLSDAAGEFEFSEVQAGKQTLRVERDGYKTLQRSLEVVGGKLTHLEIVLATPDGDPGLAEHVHNLWRSAASYTIYDGTVDLQPDETPIPPHFCYVEYRPSCYGQLLDVGDRIVPPGTEKLTISVDFEPGPFFQPDHVSDRVYEYLYVYAYGPAPPDGEYAYLYARVTQPNQTFELILPSPLNADHGHARWTSWSYGLYWGTSQYYLSGETYNAMFRSDVDVTITAHKGNLTLDPPHPRFWQDGPEIVGGGSSPTYASCYYHPEYSCSTRNPNAVTSGTDKATYCYSSCVTVGPGMIIPPGTTRIQYTIEQFWNRDGVTIDLSDQYDEPDWVFGYKTAQVPPGKATWEDWTWSDPVATAPGERGTLYTFEASIEDEWTDTYYSRLSTWAFMPGIRGQEEAPNWKGLGCAYQFCGQAMFELLEIRAINDNYDEMANGAV